MTVMNKDIKQWECLVNKIIKRHLNPKLTREDIEDLKQCGNIALYKALKSYNPDTNVSFISYASTCIIRAILREIKRLTKRSDECTMDNLEFIGQDTTNNIDRELINTDAVIKVFKAIRRLNIDLLNKKILTLKVMGYSNQEIATKLNIKKSQVSNSIFRHKQKLINKVNGGI